MDHSKKVLILYASAGHGHEKAAKAVLEACRHAPKVHARCEDVLNWAAPFFGRSYARSYLFLIRHIPAVWGFFYYLADARVLDLPLRMLRRAVNSYCAQPLVRLIENENPDVIISTHFLSTEVTAHLKKRAHTHAKLVTVITDFLPHAFWLCEPTDLYVVAFPETRDELVRRGVHAERIQVSGIPISSKFNRSADKAALRKKLHLDPALFTLLVTSGGAGVGSGEKVVTRLLSQSVPIQILFVCGTNARLKEKLSLIADKQPSLRLYGFVDNMDELMVASDLILGKAGGLTVTESLAVGTPMVVYEPVPGQEGRNAACLRRSGAGVLARNLHEAITDVVALASDPARLSAIRLKAHSLGRPDAASDLVKWILDEHRGG